MRHRIGLVVIVGLLAVILGGCGRQQGDPEDGIPVTFRVTMDRDYITSIRRAPPDVSAGVGVGVSNRGVSTGAGIGMTVHLSTTVRLLGGAAPARSGLLEQRLRRGGTEFVIPLRTGRQVRLITYASGAREGVGPLGTLHVTATDAAQVTMVLDGSGGHVVVQGGTFTPEPSLVPRDQPGDTETPAERVADDAPTNATDADEQPAE